MHWIQFLALAIVAALMLYQDIRLRLVTWLLFPAIAIMGVIYSLTNSISVKTLLMNSIINFGFLITQFMIVKLIFWLKTKRPHENKIIDQKLGVGDVLLMIACIFYFPPFSFLLFYCLSLVFVLAMHLISVVIRSKKKAFDKTIPMAGYQALFLVIYLFVAQYTKFDLIDFHIF